MYRPEQPHYTFHNIWGIYSLAIALNYNYNYIIFWLHDVSLLLTGIGIQEHLCVFMPMHSVSGVCSCVYPHVLLPLASFSHASSFADHHEFS